MLTLCSSLIFVDVIKLLWQKKRFPWLTVPGGQFINLGDESITATVQCRGTSACIFACLLAAQHTFFTLYSSNIKTKPKYSLHLNIVCIPAWSRRVLRCILYLPPRRFPFSMSVNILRRILALEFEASLVISVSSRINKTTQRNLWKTKQKVRI